MRLTADKRSQLMNRLAGQELPPPPGVALAAVASAVPWLSWVQCPLAVFSHACG